MTTSQLPTAPVPGRAPLLRALRASTAAPGRRPEAVVADVAAAVVAASNVLGSWIPALEPQPRDVTSEVVHAEPGFSVVALTLPPGTRTTIHDHLTWCVVAVIVGRETETTYRLRGARLEPVGHEHHVPGEVSTLVPPGDIHRVANETAGPVTSLHVYGADLRTAGSSVRRVYDLPESPVPTEENP